MGLESNFSEQSNSYFFSFDPHIVIALPTIATAT